LEIDNKRKRKTVEKKMKGMKKEERVIAETN